MLRALQRLGEVDKVHRTKKMPNAPSSSSVLSDSPPDDDMSSPYFARPKRNPRGPPYMTPPQTPQGADSQSLRKRSRPFCAGVQSADEEEPRSNKPNRQLLPSTSGPRHDQVEEPSPAPVRRTTRRSARQYNQKIPPTPPTTVFTSSRSRRRVRAINDGTSPTASRSKPESGRPRRTKKERP